nr:MULTISPECIES: type II toxin-antitoxin system PemK/MazF family toxin [unclassified Ectothiorhodospira]
MQKPSQIMVDKTLTVKRDKVGRPFGQLNADSLLEVERCLAVFLGIAK